jgi:hypothetical protein
MKHTEILLTCIRIRNYSYGSGSFHQQEKKSRKILFSFVLSLKTDVNVPIVSNEQKIRVKTSRTRNTARRAILLGSL